jgi:hypothetical protein
VTLRPITSIEKSGTADYYAYIEGPSVMTSFIDSALVATAVLSSFGVAFMIQSAALRLLLMAMNRR